jgi:type II secretory pathway component GspD/PulD (secretin)
LIQKDDKDYVCKTYKLKTKGIAVELASFLQTTIDLENGKINVSVDVNTGDEYIVISAPIFQFSWLEQTIEALDHPGTKFYEDGTKIESYKLKNRLASDISRFVGTVLMSKNGAVYADDRVNKLYLIDSPSYFDGTMNFIREFDVPPEMVKIEAEIIEVEGGENFDFGLALEAWKEALPEELNMEFNWDQNKTHPGGGPSSWARNAAQMLRINGVHPKAIANFINYLVSTGKAKVLSRPKIVATNGEIARIANEDTITYSAYTGPSEIMQKKTNTGLVLQIKPIIGSDTITLEIEAAIKSLLGFGEDGSPIINTRTTTSNVVLADGEVFTLSGLRKDTVTKSNSGVPVLQSIPLLGYFFRHEVDVHSKKELIVFLRPVKVRPETGLSKRESELLSAADEEMDAPPPSGVQKFVDRVIINRLD